MPPWRQGAEAILSALMHLHEPDADQVVLAAIAAAGTLSPSSAHAWRELLVREALSIERLANILRHKRNREHFCEISVWFKEGREEGLDRGRQEGRAEGIAVGKVEGLRLAVAALLDTRALVLSEADTSRLATCGNADVLARWLRQAVTASTADEALR